MIKYLQVGDGMNKNFIPKLETDKYYIGSFDVYHDFIMELEKDNITLIEGNIEQIINSMPEEYRAAIVDKAGDYVGFIGLYDVDLQNQASSIRLSTKDVLKEEDKNSILEEYKKYMVNSLNIKNIKEIVYRTKNKYELEKGKEINSPNIYIPNELLIPGVSEEVLERFQEDYDIPSLKMAYTIKNGDKVIGIIGLSNVIWSNKRANLNLFVDKSLGDDIVNTLSSYIIDDYLTLVHSTNIHSVNFAVPSSDKNMMELLKDTNMNFYAQIPFSSVNGDFLEARNMYQHIPRMKKQGQMVIPTGDKVEISLLETEKKELTPMIVLPNGYRLVSPKAFLEKQIDFEKVLTGHSMAMQERKRFTIPLGEDKYFLQKYHGEDNLSDALKNYSYILLDKDDNYSGFINILRTNANEKNAEIEMGIAPHNQRKGLGTTVINQFYDELFSIGYASVTSAVFEFNTPSNKLNEKVADFNGIRLDSYYINGRLWDMNFYTKTNQVVTNKSLVKGSIKNRRNEKYKSCR